MDAFPHENIDQEPAYDNFMVPWQYWYRIKPNSYDQKCSEPISYYRTLKKSQQIFD